MKIVKIVGDSINKKADTSEVLNFQLWKDGILQDLSNKKVFATIGDDSGFLIEIPALTNGVETYLDFSDNFLRQLPAGTYQVEFSVINEANDTEIYPTIGSVPINVSKNLHNYDGTLVPDVTIESVLETVNERFDYLVTSVKKGDKGDKGDPGKNVITPEPVMNSGDMTDEHKIYVYSGDEGDYQKGYWYYFDGQNWVAGGVYQSTGLAPDSIDRSVITPDSFKDNVSYQGQWHVGYVAGSSNTNETTGAIVATAGVSEYSHSDFIPLNKGDLLIAKFQVNNGVAGLSIFDKNKNFVKNIQEDYSEFGDLAYIATDDFEFVVISNAGVRVSKPTIQIIRNYVDDYSKVMAVSNEQKYGYYIKTDTLVPNISSTYGTSEMIVIRPDDAVVLELFGSDGTSIITEYNQAGKPVKSTQIGEKSNKYYLVRGEDDIKFIRFTNDFSKLTPIVQMSSNNNATKFGMLGDSYVRGNNTDGTLTAYNIAAIKLGFSYYNYGKNGNTIASYDGYDDNHVPMVIRYADMDDNLDIIGFEGGRNDYGNNIPMGEDTDKDVTTFKGALNVLCEGLIKKYLGKKLFGVPCWAVNTPVNSVGLTQLDYLNAFVHVVHDIWGIEVLDSRSVGVYMNSPEFLAKYTEDGNSISHLNADGHAMFANKVEDFLDAI